MQQRIVEVKSNEINLQQFLKWAAIVGSGGEAKMLIQDGLVKINGEETTTRRKKLQEGDIITFNNEVELIVKYVN